MKKYFDPLKEEWPELLKRPTQTYEQIESTVAEIFNEVSISGDTAIKKYAKKFDKADLKELLVSSESLDEAKNQLSEALKDAIKLAKRNIEAFHRSQITISGKVQTTEGVTCWQEKKDLLKR